MKNINILKVLLKNIIYYFKLAWKDATTKAIPAKVEVTRRKKSYQWYADRYINPRRAKAIEAFTKHNSQGGK